MAVMPNGQKYPEIKGQDRQAQFWLPHHGSPSKPNRSAVLEWEPSCSIDLNLAVSPLVTTLLFDVIYLSSLVLEG